MVAVADKTLILDRMSNVLVEYVGADMRLHWCNATVRDRFRVHEEDIQGKLCYRTLHKRSSHCPGCPVVKSIDGRRAVEGQMIGPEGHVWAVASTPVFDEEDEVRAVVFTAIDIQRHIVPETTPAAGDYHLGTGHETRKAALNVVSPDFDLLSVDPANAAVCGKPVAELIGKKCYKEFEKRDAPCSYCPGVVALATGSLHEAETEGFHADGTRFYCRVAAQPIKGPDGRSVGFIEMVEDITQRKRAQNLARTQERLGSSLAGMHDPAKALAQILDITLALEDLDSGCAFLADPVTRELTLVAHQGLERSCLKELARMGATAEALVYPSCDDGPQALVTLPIAYEDDILALLFAGSRRRKDVSPATLATLESIRAQVSCAMMRVKAERGRKEAVRTLEGLMSTLPLPVWGLDYQGRVTAWNRACERFFGWGQREAMNVRPPMAPEASERWGEFHALRRAGQTLTAFSLPCVLRSGESREVVVSTVPIQGEDPRLRSTLVVVDPQDGPAA